MTTEHVDTPGKQGSFFRLCDTKPLQFRTDVIRYLGFKMTERATTGVSKMPAGYTYFAQFIDHDITYATRRLEAAEGKPAFARELINERTPSLDLDSIYGRGFDDPEIKLDKRTGKFVLQRTSRAQQQSPRPFRDLPRELSGRRVISADDRADENLLLAQTTVVWMGLHNRLIDIYRRRLSKSGRGKKNAPLGHVLNQAVGPRQLFRAARWECTLIYQWVVLTDFLSELTTQRIYKAYISERFGTVSAKRGMLFHQVRGERPKIPIEFSVAAFRYGHAVVRSSYRLNDQIRDIRLDELFQMTGRGGFKGRRSLPISHLVKWDIFFSFADWRKNAPVPQRAGRFSPNLADELGRVPVEEGNLAIRNLLRSNAWGVASGQNVVREVNSKARIAGKHQLACKRVPKRKLMECMDNDPWLRASGIAKRTPLWFYLLCDSDEFGRGDRLGPLASIIVIETLLSLIRLSEVSILYPKNRWSPSTSSLAGHLKKKRKNRSRLTMADVIKLAQPES